MAETRTVELRINAVEINTIHENVGIDNFNDAIGYLTTWNYTYPKVIIYAQDGHDLVAVYKTEDNNTGYVIGAVWHENHYGFHS